MAEKNGPDYGCAVLLKRNRSASTVDPHHIRAAAAATVSPRCFCTFVHQNNFVKLRTRSHTWTPFRSIWFVFVHGPIVSASFLFLCGARYPGRVRTLIRLPQILLTSGGALFSKQYIGSEAGEWNMVWHRLR